MSSSVPPNGKDRYVLHGVNPPGTAVTDGWKWIKAQLPPDAYSALQHLAETTGESQRSIVRRAVVELLRSAGAPHLLDVGTTHTSRRAPK